MCLAIPARVISIDDESDTATVSLGEIEKQISLALVSDVAINDYVLVHVGYALNKISIEEAEKTLAMFAEAGLLGAQP
jgi:hydrogenase expression/formation protein HypC